MSVDNPFSLVGKTILVTGASSGIGQSIAIECSKMGAQVIVTARNQERLKKTYFSLWGDGHQMFLADMSQEQDIDALVSNVPVINGLVNCAGIAKPLLFQFAKSEYIHEIMNVNFEAPAMLTQKFLKNKKIEKKSSIVFISSVSGYKLSSISNSVYSASKSAINGLVKGLALEVASKKIRVNTVNPGMIDTNFFSSGEITQEQLAEDVKKYPLMRYGKPEDVAYAVIYLLSDASEWVTGSNLLIDGGLTLQ